MKYSIFILVAFALQLNFAFAATSSYNCRDIGKYTSSDNKITITLDGNSATLINYWGSGDIDNGTLKKVKPNGDLVFQGFENWVDDGLEDSGYMFVSSELLKYGRGTVILYNKYCEENCTDRSAKLICTKR